MDGWTCVRIEWIHILKRATTHGTLPKQIHEQRSSEWEREICMDCLCLPLFVCMGTIFLTLYRNLVRSSGHFSCSYTLIHLLTHAPRAYTLTRSERDRKKAENFAYGQKSRLRHRIIRKLTIVWCIAYMR